MKCFYYLQLKGTNMRLVIIIIGLAALLALTGCGSPPLVMAAFEGKTTRVESLLADGADVNVKQDGGCTALYLAAQEGYTEIVKLLLDKGADVNVETDAGFTPLWISVQNGHTKVVELLLDKGAYVEVKHPDDEGTPLLMAAQEGHIEIVRLLLEKDANVNAKLTSGLTPLWMAAQNGHTEIVKQLLEKGANADPRRNSDGLTPLWMAAQDGHTEVVKLLLDKGADIETCENDGATPLYMALQNGHTDIAKILLENHANPNAKFAETSWTCLHLASKQGYVNMAKILIQAGVGINAKDYKGQTALNFAARYCQRDIFNLLMDSGAKISVVDRMREGAAMSFLLASEYYEAKGDFRNAIDTLKKAQTKCNELYEDYDARYKVLKAMNDRERLAAFLAPIQASLMSYKMSNIGHPSPAKQQLYYDSYMNTFERYWITPKGRQVKEGSQKVHECIIIAQEWRSISDNCTRKIKELSTKLL